MNYDSINETSNSSRSRFLNQTKAMQMSLDLTFDQERQRMMSQGRKTDDTLGSSNHKKFQKERFRKYNEIFVSNDCGKPETRVKDTTINTTEWILQQITAVLLVCMLNLMISIPFGVSYFPVEWRNSDESGSDDGNTEGGGEYLLLKK